MRSFSISRGYVSWNICVIQSLGKSDIASVDDEYVALEARGGGGGGGVLYNYIDLP